MALSFDSIPFDRMSPDSSEWEKGLRLVANLAPGDGGGWRELREASIEVSATVAAGSKVSGKFSDPNGRIYIALDDVFNTKARLYEYTPAIVPSPPALTNRTPGTDYAASIPAWSFTKFGTTVIAAPHSATIQLQGRTGTAGNFANLVTSADRPAPKYITVSKSHVVGANTLAGGGVYAAANPYQIMWCARNNAAVWTPGTDRAGFAPDLNDDSGELTGVRGFKDFFVSFQQQAVVRWTWIGGNEVWSPQEIGAHEFGLGGNQASPLWAGSVVRAQRDLYYFANRGPAVIRNGEAPEPLGDGVIRRFLMDQFHGASITESFTADRSVTVDGEYDSPSASIVWTIGHLENPGFYYKLIYHIASDRFSIIDGENTASHAGAVRTLSDGSPLNTLRYFRVLTTSLDALGFLQNTTYIGRLYTKHWRGKIGARVALQSARPLFLIQFGNYPVLTLIVDAAAEPRFNAASTVQKTFTTAALDDNGWMIDEGFPLEFTEMRAQLRIASLDSLSAIKELPALELAFQESSVY